MNVPGGSLVVKRHFFGAMFAIGGPEDKNAGDARGTSGMGTARHFIKDTRARSRPNRC